ncbi:hypothetical protein B0H13DRAFT_2358059 [Mycena leptocephala]|nr:hypothetical protein B0H13DRAFT_2358059 [Mycena leptocephala]
MSQNLIEPLSNLSLVVGLVLSIYDHLLTLAPEIRLYWQPPRPWFLLIRYLNLAGNIIMAVLTFGNFGPESGMNTCQWLHLTKKAFLIVQESIIYAILTLRVYVVFNRDWRILVLLSLSGLGSLAVGAWLRATANGGALPESLCILSNASGIRIAGAWEAGLLRDVLIFALTLQRGISHWRHENYRSPVLRLLLFLVRMILNTELRTLSKEWNSAIALVDLADILVYYFGDPAVAGSLGWLASDLSVVLTIRLMLNMREVIDTGTAGSEGDDVTSVEWNIVDLQVGTREVGTTSGHAHVRNRSSGRRADDDVYLGGPINTSSMVQIVGNSNRPELKNAQAEQEAHIFLEDLQITPVPPRSPYNILDLPFEMTAKIFSHVLPPYPARSTPVASVIRDSLAWCVDNGGPRHGSISSPELWRALQLKLMRAL